MGCTAAELGERMSSRELTEHIVQAEREPWGDWWRAVGMILAEMRNGQRTKRDDKIWMPWECVGVPPPVADDEPAEEAPVQTLEEIEALFRQSGVEVKRVDHH